ncbi:TerD family protein [Actinomadura verrucosospora]|uniref:TerD family protein n=1 Tax=Actinomadura verrucosospora TaxID=46165 RepID=UPI0035EBD898
MVMAEFYRHTANGATVWKLRAVGQGWSDGLDGLARAYGVHARHQSVPSATQPSGRAPAGDGTAAARERWTGGRCSCGRTALRPERERA